MINLWQILEIFTFNLIFSAVEDYQKIFLGLLIIYFLRIFFIGDFSLEDLSVVLIVIGQGPRKKFETGNLPCNSHTGRWESNINVWFPFMYSQKWKYYFQKRIKMFCLPVPKLIYLIISVRDSCISRIGLPILLQGNMWTHPGNIYVNRSQTHECGNWD